jgi:hypothetical protein
LRLGEEGITQRKHMDEWGVLGSSAVNDLIILQGLVWVFSYNGIQIQVPNLG